MSNSGASEASGASHCTSRNSLDAERRRPAVDQRLARTARRTAGSRPRPTTNRRDDRRPPSAPASNEPSHRAGPTRCGSSAGRARHRIMYEHEDRRPARTASNSVIECLQRQRQRVERRDGRGTRSRPRCGSRSSAMLADRRAASRAPRAVARPVPGDEHDHRPADADQQPVGAGHVGERERARRRVPALEGSGRPAPYCANACPAFHVNTKSTAYSGSTAISASTASASPAEMSSCATSAAHARMNAAPDDRAGRTAAASTPMREMAGRSTEPRAARQREAQRERRDASRDPGHNVSILRPKVSAVREGSSSACARP